MLTLERTNIVVNWEINRFFFAKCFIKFLYTLWDNSSLVLISDVTLFFFLYSWTTRFFFTYLYFEEKLLFWVITVLKIIISKSIFFSAIRDFAFYSFFWQMLWLLVFKFFKNPAFESEVFYMLSLLDETLKDFLNLVLNYAFQSSL